MSGERGPSGREQGAEVENYRRKLEAVLQLSGNQIPQDLRDLSARFLSIDTYPSEEFFYSGLKYFNQELFKLGVPFAELDLDPTYQFYSKQTPQGVDFLKYLEQYETFYPGKVVRASSGKSTKRENKSGFNLVEARKLGLSLEYLPAITKADDLIRRIFASNHDINITTSAGQVDFFREWMNNVVDVAGEPLPLPGMPWPKEFAAYFSAPYPSQQGKDGNVEYLKAVALGRIARDDTHSLPVFGRSEKILVDDYKETPDKRAVPAMRIRPPESQLMQALGITRAIFDVTPDEINRALYKTVNNITSYTERHFKALEKLGLDPAFWEIRLIAYDEYNRLANEKSWGYQEVWTIVNDKIKNSKNPGEVLATGHRNYGGASAIRPITRQSSGFAARLVVAPVSEP